MRQKILSTAFSLGLLGCVGLPPKPVIRVCVVDYPRMEAICGDSQGEVDSIIQTLGEDPLPTCPAELPEGRICRMPLAELDKATAFAPMEWEKVKNYIDQLEEWGKRKCN